MTAKVLEFWKPSNSYTIECVGLESGYVYSLTKYDSPRNVIEIRVCVNGAFAVIRDFSSQCVLNAFVLASN